MTGEVSPRICSAAIRQLGRFRPTGCVQWTSRQLHCGFSSRQDPISAQFAVSDTCLNSEKGGLYFLSAKRFFLMLSYFFL